MMSAPKQWMRKLCQFWRQEHLEEEEMPLISKPHQFLEEQDDEQDREQQYTTLLTQQDLQRTVDPLIATQVYNKKHSPLAGLPEEILLQIVQCMGDDRLALFCLRRVSRCFRRIIHDPAIDRDSMFRINAYPSESLWRLPYDIQTHLRQRLLGDGMCDECKLWCDTPAVKGFSGWRRQERNLGANRPRPGRPDCVFAKRCGPKIHCDACGTHQATQSFSQANQSPGKRYRQCLGHDGAVKLCEHVYIRWAEIENHITDWQKRNPGGDWQVCVGQFSIECHDPSHDMRCAAHGAPTWPRASLQSRPAGKDEKVVFLSLEWSPHSGLDTFTLTSHRQVHVSELRAVLQRYRAGPAGDLLPSYSSNPLPEMACFDPAKCCCVQYEAGDGTEPPAVDPYQQLGPFDIGKCRTWHTLLRVYPFGAGAEVVFWRHGLRRLPRSRVPRAARGSVCLVAAYQRRVLVYCGRTDNGKVNPTHEWLHAMDPDTYSRSETGQYLPLCKDRGCMNYYRRPGAFRCPTY